MKEYELFYYHHSKQKQYCSPADVDQLVELLLPSDFEISAIIWH